MQQRQAQHDQRAKERKFEIDDLIYVRKCPASKEWIPGQISKVLAHCHIMRFVYQMELMPDVALITFEQDTLKNQIISLFTQVTGWLHLIRLQHITTRHNNQTAHLLHVVRLEYLALLIVMDINRLSELNLFSSRRGGV